MSIRVTIDQLREQLPELIRRAAESGEECIIQRNGEDYAVLVSAREWEQKREPMSRADAGVQERLRREVGRWLDAMGPEYRLSPERQARMEELLARKEELSEADRGELEELLQEGEAILLRRAAALDRIR